MLQDWHQFSYRATIPWPNLEQQSDWIQGLHLVEEWLVNHIGPRYQNWAYNDSAIIYNIGVAFKWDKDRTLFVLAWSN
jgi:hypothetical protein